MHHLFQCLRAPQARGVNGWPPKAALIRKIAVVQANFTIAKSTHRGVLANSGHANSGRCSLAKTVLKEAASGNPSISNPEWWDLWAHSKPSVAAGLKLDAGRFPANVNVKKGQLGVNVNVNVHVGNTMNVKKGQLGVFPNWKIK